MNGLPDHVLTVQAETLRFLGSLLIGIPAGLLLECLRTLRALLPHPQIAVFLEDTLFAALCGGMLLSYSAVWGGGAVRWYDAAGAMLGLALWLLTLGALWRRFLRILVHIRHRAARALCRLLQKTGRFFVGNPKNDAESKKNSEMT